MPLYESSASIGGVATGLADTASAAGSSTAPAAGAAIATIAAPGAGVYRVVVKLRMSATAETAATNAELRHGATVVGKVGITSDQTLQTVEYERVTVAAAEAITVNATANATAGAVYNVVVTAVRVG